MEASSVSPRTDSKPFPDVILRSQFFDLAGRPSLSSEQRLMLAVLADAINIVQGFHSGDSSRKRTTFDEARAWIFAKGSSYPLSFENVCDALGLNTAALRWRLGALMSQTSSGAHVTPLRLRLKEAGRVQRVTVNRVRRRT
ncbi:MAG TPA: hypothetical protein VEC38_12965, partial [Candidatus Binataceae bacterium]|nr:hypothetical protein [Candidatus Binataceae bacterium]